MRGRLTVERRNTTTDPDRPHPILIATLRVGSAIVTRTYNPRDFGPRILRQVLRDLMPKIRPHAHQSWALYDNPRLRRRELWHNGRVWECASPAVLHQLLGLPRIGAYSYFDIARPFESGSFVGRTEAMGPAAVYQFGVPVGAPG